jgi:hypothetical protein
MQSNRCSCFQCELTPSASKPDGTSAGIREIPPSLDACRFHYKRRVHDYRRTVSPRFR